MGHTGRGRREGGGFTREGGGREEGSLGKRQEGGRRAQGRRAPHSSTSSVSAPPYYTRIHTCTTPTLAFTPAPLAPIRVHA